MYPHTKFQLISITLDFGTKLAPKNMNDIILKKKIKFEIRIWQCTSVPNSGQFGELGFGDQICPKSTLG